MESRIQTECFNADSIIVTELLNLRGAFKSHVENVLME